ncbi:putative disease resistance protein At3g14460 [Neltuma alba]|uniref:putative disease resistance protein At3g14460 n=1 Tax=Neltuma alba TaxID=207710 RepID=UPI0010A4DB62|nr:putative disease resistance protein At3g14460 [Prosopis alba]
MAAAAVGQALLSASLQTLLERITSSEFRDFMKNRKLNVSLLDELKMTLLMLDAILNDAEEKQITNDGINKWLEELKDAVYDAEDLLDEIHTESLRCKMKKDSQGVTNKVRSFFSPSFGQFYLEMNSKLEATSRRLENFVKQKDILGLQSVSTRGHKTPTTSLVNEFVVVGREDDKEKLLKMLLCDEDPKGNAIGVITIWGMGGLGKTTLAQLLYNDKTVQDNFDLKVWACISNDFNLFRLTKNLVESITSKVYNSTDIDYLRVKLRNRLSNKKFLIVLDDLWNEKYSDWDDLITPFHSGRRGSKIIITTRQQRVVEITHTFPVHKLSCLSDDNCWFLLSKHAFANEDPNKYPQLEAIGRKIARKCSGLPIAAKTIGGLLRSKVDATEWNKILNNNLWDIPNDDVLPALRLSYLALPSHLKKCFAYCSIFSKDLLLEKNKLVLLWMAEGFVPPHSHGKKTLEAKADECFNELLSRSFIQQYEGDPRKFLMHDLINDLAKVVSGKSCLWFEGNEIPKTLRHLSYTRKRYDGAKMFENFDQLNCLRTFLPQSKYGWAFPSYLTGKVIHDLLPRLKRLRVLSLSCYDNVNELPDSIGDLQHLRYLDLSYTPIRRLPDAFFKLHNLQTLLLSYCRNFIELPEKIKNLINLRHLDISGTALEEMPTQITELQNLQSLSSFMVGKLSNGLGIKELNKLPHLQGKLSILKLQNVVDSEDALDANLRRREKIEDLVLKWDGDDTQDSQIVKMLLDMLQPSTNLQRLTIDYYGGTSFPKWVGDSSFTYITFLSVSNCKYCFSLPPFGQLPSLKELLIRRMGLVQIIGREFYYNRVQPSSFQPFPLLEILEFEDMPVWEEWIPFEGEAAKFPFPHLRQLRLSYCPMLRGDMPVKLPSLTKVYISNCEQLEAKSLSSQWITSIEELKILQGGQGLLRALDDYSLSSLKHLTIQRCYNLQCLPRMTVNCHCLQELFLFGAPSIMFFPTDSLPTSLQRLLIQDCEKLEFMPQESWRSQTSIEELMIDNSCHSLISFPLDCFPRLKKLVVFQCHNLETFTNVGRSNLSLEKLAVHHCQKLGSMSEVHVNSLASLQFFSLEWLPNLESLPQCGLPSNLRYLIIRGCNGLSPIPFENWGFHRLTSLSQFEVEGSGIENILQNLLKNQMMPTSLVRMVISDVHNLELLDGKGLHRLTSLKRLSIYGCPKLESLPEDCLPSSLLFLNIWSCPKLEARYHFQGGRHLSKITHIPTIIINGEYHDPWYIPSKGLRR